MKGDDTGSTPAAGVPRPFKMSADLVKLATAPANLVPEIPTRVANLNEVFFSTRQNSNLPLAKMLARRSSFNNNDDDDDDDDDVVQFGANTF